MTDHLARRNAPQIDLMEVLEEDEPDGFVAEPTEAEPACALPLPR